MARVKTARTTRARHKKILKQAKGYYGVGSMTWLCIEKDLLEVA